MAHRTIMTSLGHRVVHCSFSRLLLTLTLSLLGLSIGYMVYFKDNCLETKVRSMSANKLTTWSNDFHISPIHDHSFKENHLETKVRSVSANKLTIWSIDFHISPIHDLKDLLQPLGVRFIDKSLSGHCHLTGTCAKDLRVLNRGNGMSPSTVDRKAFVETYRNDGEMKEVDAFVCFHPAAMCELFMPFGKPLIVIASTRYELGRQDPTSWKSWNKNLLAISKDPRNVVAANNMYDAEYIRYFTGIDTIVLPSFCGYLPKLSHMERTSKVIGGQPYLLAPIHAAAFEKKIMVEIGEKGKNAPVKITPLRKLYPHYIYSDLVKHPGIVYIPYQVSTMSIFEQYRANIPLFFPSLDLLTEWQFKDKVVSERTWDGVVGKIPKASIIPGVLKGVPDPNCETDKAAVRFWLRYADFYQWPHITYYDSIEDLYKKLQTANLTDLRIKMHQQNTKVRENLLNTWKTILRKIKKGASFYTGPR